MLHFFFGVPRLIMILAPLSFLLFGLHPFRADVPAVIAYILPHIGLSTIANSTISRNYRHSFSAGIYEVSIAPYAAAVTLLALINPRFGKFNVTDKGANLEKARFDYRTAWPTLVLLAISVAALMVAFPARILAYGRHGGNPGELDAVLVNSVWALANFIILLAAACVAYEQPQRRAAPRVRRPHSCSLLLEGTTIDCDSEDISESGIRVLIRGRAETSGNARISIHSGFGVEALVEAALVWRRAKDSEHVEAAFSFVDLDSATHQKLVQLIFSGDQTWTQQNYQKDRVWHSFWRLVTTFWRISAPSARTGFGHYG
jgi:cellulose synthase (UDP-forming)